MSLIQCFKCGKLNHSNADYCHFCGNAMMAGRYDSEGYETKVMRVFCWRRRTSQEISCRLSGELDAGWEMASMTKKPRRNGALRYVYTVVLRKKK